MSIPCQEYIPREQIVYRDVQDIIKITFTSKAVWKHNLLKFSKIIEGIFPVS